MRGVLLVVAMSCALVAAPTPQAASARWTSVSAAPSATQPYLACPRRGHRPRCALIEDPVRGTISSGPVRAGAITTGPELEVSPALYGNGVEGGYSPENLRDAYKSAVVIGGGRPDGGCRRRLRRSGCRIGPEGLPCALQAARNAPPQADASGRSIRRAEPRATRLPTIDWAREISLDLDMVSAICPNCKILLVEANSESSADLADSEDEAAALRATEISNSFVGGHAVRTARRRRCLRSPRDTDNRIRRG